MADESNLPPGLDAEPGEQERELTALEMMNAPARPTESRRRTVLWICLAFATMLLALTFAVIALYGLDLLTLFSVVVLGFLVAAMLGAVRYKGEDPMAQFDPPERPKPRGFWRRSS